MKRHHDLAAALLMWAALLTWDIGGADGVVTRWFGSAQGFAWRDHFITAGLVHQGGRLLAWATLLALLVCALRAPRSAVVGMGTGAGAASSPVRAHRWYWLAVTVLSLLLVPAIKRTSATSCPWDLAEFGGSARTVSHWLWGLADGGPGHCFPSGHAVGAFAFFSQYFLWRNVRPGRARVWLLLVLVTGGVFGIGQLARGAHHLSHSLWSGWLCWALSAAANRAQPQRWR